MCESFSKYFFHGIYKVLLTTWNLSKLENIRTDTTQLLVHIDSDFIFSQLNSSLVYNTYDVCFDLL